VFVAPRVLQRNIQHTVAGRKDFLTSLATVVKRRVILLDEAPEHHLGMFMASVGGHVMLVATRNLAKVCCRPNSRR